MTTDIAHVSIRKRQFGGWHVYHKDTLIGWVVRAVQGWSGYIVIPGRDDGQLVAHRPTRREAVDEVYIRREAT